MLTSRNTDDLPSIHEDNKDGISRTVHLDAEFFGLAAEQRADHKQPLINDRCLDIFVMAHVGTAIIRPFLGRPFHFHREVPHEGERERDRARSVLLMKHVLYGATLDFVWNYAALLDTTKSPRVPQRIRQQFNATARFLFAYLSK
jgi:hypothetical protein